MHLPVDDPRRAPLHRAKLRPRRGAQNQGEIPAGRGGPERAGEQRKARRYTQDLAIREAHRGQESLCYWFAEFETGAEADCRVREPKAQGSPAAAKLIRLVRHYY